MGISRNEVIGLTGNSFVDTGLAAVASLAGLDDAETLTVKDLRRVHGDGRRLSSWNGSLKNFTMVFTKNSLLTNASIKDQGKRTNMYLSVINGLLDRIGHEELAFRCECCGAPRALDFDRLCRCCLAQFGGSDQARFVGRDWFPLAGSLGSDAQALPAASRPVHLCAKCLFAVHYLPLGLILLDGKLTVFQSTSIAFWYELVRDIVNEVQSRIRAGNYDNLGAKEGGRAIVRRLLALFERLQRAKRFSDILPATALEAWRFTNSNPPSCDVIEIPNPVLRFLWEAVGCGLRQEIENLVSREGKRERPFLRCILEHRDYRGLYPTGKYAGVSPNLFVLYQTFVCGRAPGALALAHIVASERANELSRKELERVKREEAFSEPSVRTQFRAMIARLVSEGRFTLGDYLGLFPLIEGQCGIRVGFDGWNLIRYYLHHIDGVESSRGLAPTPSRMPARLATVRYYAAQIMQDYFAEHGKNTFRSDVLNRMARGEIGAGWLNRRFVRLGESTPGFSYEAWRELCTHGGQVLVRELLFHMRLLWSEWMREDNIPQVATPELREGPGLPCEVAERLKYIFSEYVERRGLKRFQVDVLTRLRRGQIGLEWFRRQFAGERKTSSEWQSLSQDEWEHFLRDEEGCPCTGERLFQMHLMLANLYRVSGSSKKGVAT